MSRTRSLFLAAAMPLLICRGAHAADISPETLQKLKDATAFVTLTSSLGAGSGSAFLVRKQGATGFLVTSAHVVSPRGLAASNIKVTFYSGTPNEIELPVSSVSLGKDADLAILKVTSKRLPEPISLEQTATIAETTPVIILGFPFGKELSLTEGAPSLTVARGSISSIRKDENGNVKVIQIDGNLNPGNSGGPVLSHDGALVGVSTATVLGTQIGLTIPKSEIMALLSGKLCDISYDVIGQDKTGLVIQVAIDLIDPLDSIKTIGLRMALKSKVDHPPSRNAIGQWSRLDPADINKSLPVRSARASVTLSVPITSIRDEYLVQSEVATGPQPSYSEPQTWSLGIDLDMVERKLNRGKASPKATDRWLEAPEGANEEAASKPVTVSEKSVAGLPRIVVDASVIPIVIGGTPVSSALWARNGASFFLLTGEGNLHEVSVPDLVEKRVVSLGSACSDLALSRDGVLVLNSAMQKLLVLDELTLAVKAGIPTGGRTGLTSSPESYLAFIGHEEELAMIDLRKRKVVAEYTPNEIQQRYGNSITKHPDGVMLTEFGSPQMTPDGKYLFCIGFECLHRFRIRAQELVYEEMGPRIGKGRVEISDDSAYVAIPSGGGDAVIKGQTVPGPYGTYVFSTADLQQPVTGIPRGHSSRCLAFDKLQKCIYTSDFEMSLIQFSPSGVRLKSYPISPRGEETTQILVHPLGKGLLLKTEKSLYWCQIDGGERAGTLPDTGSATGTKAIELWKPAPDLYSRILKTAPSPGPQGLMKKLPEFPHDVVPAYGGVYLVMQFKKLGKLGIFNIAQAKFDKYIQLDDPDVVYAAGGDMLVVYSPQKSMFHRWNLATLEQMDSKPCQLPTVITAMAMAMECSDLAVVSHADMSQALGNRQYAILDTGSLNVIPLSSETPFKDMHSRDAVQIRVDPRLTGLTIWNAGASPNGFTYGAIRGQTIKLASQHADYGSLALSNDGKKIYCSNGLVVDLTGRIQERVEKAMLFSMYGSDLFLELEGNELRLRDPDILTPIKKIELPFKKAISRYHPTTVLSDDRRVFACSPLQRLAIINENETAAYVFDLGQNNRPSAGKETDAHPGARWVRKLGFAAGSTILLEDGPAEMKVDADTQRLVWDVPKNTPPGEIKILLSVTAPGKAEEIHTVSVAIR